MTTNDEQNVETGSSLVPVPTDEAVAVSADSHGDSVENASQASDDNAGDDAPTPRRAARLIFEWTAIVGASVLVAVLLRTYVVQTFYIPSGSMEPTLQVGDRILVNKLAYDVHPINRSDIVVFGRPPTEFCAGPPVNDLVKRVIGLPGDWIKSVGNTVFINNKPLSEPYLPKPDPIGIPIPLTHIGPNQYFVMGDNRADSCDSRIWGTLDRSYIIGQVFFIIWPLNHAGFPA